MSMLRGIASLLLLISTVSASFAEEKAQAPSSPASAPKDSATKKEAAPQKSKKLGIVLYERFELLDVFGPAEIFGNVGKNRLQLVMIADKAGPVASTQGPKAVADFGLDECPPLDFILVPGGIGTIQQLGNKRLHDWLRQRSESAEIVMSVCSGSAILAKAGLLDGKKATTNKQSYRLLTAQGKTVNWVKEARWVEDGKFVTSSGVSAGVDMALAVVGKLYGPDLAQRIADGTEYEWRRDSSWDPFAKFAK